MKAFQRHSVLREAVRIQRLGRSGNAKACSFDERLRSRDRFFGQFLRGRGKRFAASADADAGRSGADVVGGFSHQVIRQHAPERRTMVIVLALDG